MNISATTLQCPHCQSSDTHINAVHVSARDEDGAFNEIRVQAESGQIASHLPEVGPGHEMRRHRISLLGYCEKCMRGIAIVFTQHKGATLVEYKEMDGGDPWINRAWTERP